jgi:hypothetical protein
MTCPKQVSERLILMPSCCRSPVAPVFSTRSEPARSTRFSLPLLHKGQTVRCCASSINVPDVWLSILIDFRALHLNHENSMRAGRTSVHVRHSNSSIFVPHLHHLFRERIKEGWPSCVTCCTLVISFSFLTTIELRSLTSPVDLTTSRLRSLSFDNRSRTFCTAKVRVALK